MAKVPCFCGAHIIEANDATYVKNGKPMCSAATCDQTRWHDKQGYARVPLASLAEANLAAG